MRKKAFLNSENAFILGFRDGFTVS